MKKDYLRILWLAYAVSAMSVVILLSTISDLSLFMSSPALYIASVAIACTGLCLLMNSRSSLPVFTDLTLQGKLIMAPLWLFLYSTPAAIIFIFYDLNGRETQEMLSGLLASLSAIFFLSSLFTFTFPAMQIVLRAGTDKDDRGGEKMRFSVITVIMVLLIMPLVVITTKITGSSLARLIVVLPLASLLISGLMIALAAEFRNRAAVLTEREEVKGEKGMAGPWEPEDESLFYNRLSFQSHYIDLVCGRLSFLKERAAAIYASGIVDYAGRTLDPGVAGALEIITGEPRFNDPLRKKAGSVLSNIERYYNDPTRNIEIIKGLGIPEKYAMSRSVLKGRRSVQPADILKLLSDNDPEIRRTGLTAAGLYNMTELIDDIIQALSHPGTEKEAYYLLRYFGPEVYHSSIGFAVRPRISERESLMIMRLIALLPVPDAMQEMIRFLSFGYPTIRLEASKYLTDNNFIPDYGEEKLISEIITATVFNLARLKEFRILAIKNGYFLLSTSLESEVDLNYKLLFSLIGLLAGRNVSEVIRTHAMSGTASGAGLAAELISRVITGPAETQLKALLGSHHDSDRIRDLSSCLPLRTVSGHNLLDMMLSYDQNVTGAWTKACALHILGGRSSEVRKETVLSYLFSNNPLLLEEAVRVILAVNPGWYSEVQNRISPQARLRTQPIVNGEVATMAMLWEKTRFLSLCFKNIPEDRMVLLASALRYSVSYDAGDLPGLLTWIVPTESGNSGLYLLPLTDIIHFIFHYPEYTGIFAEYIDRQGNLTEKEEAFHE